MQAAEVIAGRHCRYAGYKSNDELGILGKALLDIIDSIKQQSLVCASTKVIWTLKSDPDLNEIL